MNIKKKNKHMNKTLLIINNMNIKKNMHIIIKMITFNLKIKFMNKLKNKFMNKPISKMKEKDKENLHQQFLKRRVMSKEKMRL